MRVTYIQADGIEQSVEVPEGTSVMQGAMLNDIDGIVAECGGSMSCATCHVYVDEAFLDGMPPINETQEEMLEFTAAPREPNSRLSCQIRMTQALDGLVVRLPDRQY